MSGTSIPSSTDLTPSSTDLGDFYSVSSLLTATTPSSSSLNCSSNPPSSNTSHSSSPSSSHDPCSKHTSDFTRQRPRPRDEGSDTVPSMKYNRLGLASKFIEQIESNKPPAKPNRRKSKIGDPQPPQDDREEIPKPRLRKKLKTSYSIFHQIPPVPPSPSRTPTLPPYLHHPQSPDLLPSPELHRHEYQHPRTTPDVLLEEVVSVVSSHYTEDLPEVEEARETVIEKFFRIILLNEDRLFNITYRLRQKARRYARHHADTSCCGRLCGWAERWKWNCWRIFYFVYDFFDRADAKRRKRWTESRSAVVHIMIK